MQEQATLHGSSRKVPVLAALGGGQPATTAALADQMHLRCASSPLRRVGSCQGSGA